jgi:crotonobetainyl-CoA:carnitine CoA-transferase CaiB-like acyl-CoA transferase
MSSTLGRSNTGSRVSRLAGAGQSVEIPQLAAAMFAMCDARVVDGEVHQTFAIDGEQRGHSESNRLYRARDGWVLLACYSEREWRAAHAAFGLTPRESFVQTRARVPGPDGESPLAGAIAKLPAAEAAARLEAGRAVAAVPDRTCTDDPATLVTDELLDLRVFVQYDHPQAGRVFEVGETVRFTGCVPADEIIFGLGDHTVAILAELGYTDAEVADLLASGAATRTGEPGRR